jgi:hypothetical protein
VGSGGITGNNDTPKPSPTPKDLENELTCGDAGREQAAAVAISQAIATTGETDGCTTGLQESLKAALQAQRLSLACQVVGLLDVLTLFVPPASLGG